MTIDQIDFVLRKLGWDGTPATAPKVCISSSVAGVMLPPRMWIERGLVVLRHHDGKTSWKDASEITRISQPSNTFEDQNDEPDPPTLRVVE